MATIIPFKGIRPVTDKVHLVASRSVDSYSKAELQEKLRSNRFSFLHIIHPDFTDGVHTDPHSVERLQKIKKRFLEFEESGVLIQDASPAYYVYRQIKNNHTFTGIIAGIGIDDYFNGTIKVHEQTITERENKLKDYLEVCDFNAEPVLFCYQNNARIDACTAEVCKQQPVYDFTTSDGIRHSIWMVWDVTTVTAIEEEFKKQDAVYIADGHHRSASSALLGASRRKSHPNFSGKESFNFYLGVFFPESELQIFDYNRVVKDLNGHSVDSFLDALSGNFTVELKGAELYQPAHKHKISMYLAGNWYCLSPKEGIVNDREPVGSLDASILSAFVLSPILGIGDLKTNKRIGFIPGVKGMEALKMQVDKGNAQVAFGLFPVEMAQLKRIADTNQIMPPKTTWVEPKMRNGLIIYSLANS